LDLAEGEAGRWLGADAVRVPTVAAITGLVPEPVGCLVWPDLVLKVLDRGLKPDGVEGPVSYWAVVVAVAADDDPEDICDENRHQQRWPYPAVHGEAPLIGSGSMAGLW
jgi:hypothetical protein